MIKINQLKLPVGHSQKDLEDKRRLLYSTSLRKRRRPSSKRLVLQKLYLEEVTLFLITVQKDSS